MSKHKVQTSFMNIGASSLLVIFIVLCIAIFATLSLSGAKSDYSFSENMAQHKADYYEACNSAEQTLALVDEALSEAFLGASGEQDYFARAAVLLSEGAFGAELSVNDAGAAAGNAETTGFSMPTVSWQVPIDDSQVLDVEISLNWPMGSNADGAGLYVIKKWQTTGL